MPLARGPVGRVEIVDGERDGQIFQRPQVLAIRIGQTHDDGEPAVALEHQPGLTAAHGDRQHVEHVADVQAVAGDRGPVELGLQHGQARGLLDLHVRGSGDAFQCLRELGRGLLHQWELVAIDFHRHVRAYAGD